MIVCDGCGKEMKDAKVGQIHEVLYDISDRFPDLCGYAKRVNKKDWLKWQKEKNKRGHR
jgi:hypothetical protein